MTSVAFSPDGTRIVSGSWDHTLIIWNAHTGQQVRDEPLKGHTNTVMSVAFSPDGTRIVSQDYSNKTLVWDASTGKHLADEQPPPSLYASSAPLAMENAAVVQGPASSAPPKGGKALDVVPFTLDAAPSGAICFGGRTGCAKLANNVNILHLVGGGD